MSQPSKPPERKWRTFNRYLCTVSLTLGYDKSSFIKKEKTFSITLSFCCPYTQRWLSQHVWSRWVSHCRHLIKCSIEFEFCRSVDIPEDLIGKTRIFHNSESIMDYITSEIVFSLMMWEYQTFPF